MRPPALRSIPCYSAQIKGTSVEKIETHEPKHADGRAEQGSEERWVKRTEEEGEEGNKREQRGWEKRRAVSAWYREQRITCRNSTERAHRLTLRSPGTNASAPKSRPQLRHCSRTSPAATSQRPVLLKKNDKRCIAMIDSSKTTGIICADWWRDVPCLSANRQRAQTIVSTSTPKPRLGRGARVRGGWRLDFKFSFFFQNWPRRLWLFCELDSQKEINSLYHTTSISLWFHRETLSQHMFLTKRTALCWNCY